MATVIDSYSESNYNNNIDGLGGGYTTRHFQSFTATECKLNYCQFYMYKGGTPTGNVVAKLYAHSGTYGTNSVPTGTALATSDNVLASSIGTTIGLVTFTFSGDQRINIVPNNYCIAIEYSGGDASNYLVTGIDTSSPTHGGNKGYWNGSAWVSESTDRIFYVYGDVYTTGPFPTSILT